MIGKMDHFGPFLFHYQGIPNVTIQPDRQHIYDHDIYNYVELYFMPLEYGGDFWGVFVVVVVVKKTYSLI